MVRVIMFGAVSQQSIAWTNVGQYLRCPGDVARPQ